MPTFQCNNQECNNGALLFDSNLPQCPQCKSIPPIVGVATLIHFCYRDNNGPLTGFKNFKVNIACKTNTPSSPFNCSTNLPYLVNCLKCKETQEYKKYWYPDPQNIMSYFQNPNLEPVKSVSEENT